jgi:hypothetical protein
MKYCLRYYKYKATVAARQLETHQLIPISINYDGKKFYSKNSRSPHSAKVDLILFSGQKQSF